MTNYANSVVQRAVKILDNAGLPWSTAWADGNTLCVRIVGEHDRTHMHIDDTLVQNLFLVYLGYDLDDDFYNSIEYYSAVHRFDMKTLLHNLEMNGGWRTKAS